MDPTDGKGAGILARRVLDALVRRDATTLIRLLDEGVVWHLSDPSPLSGDYRGFDAVQGLFQDLIDLLGGMARFELRRVVTGDRSSVWRVSFDVFGHEEPGYPAAIVVCEVRDGLVVEGWQHATSGGKRGTDRRIQ